MHLCWALWAEAQLSQVVLRVEVFIPLSLRLFVVLQQAPGPSQHVQIILVPRHMHSNQFIIYFIFIPWLQFEADGFIIHDKQPFDSRAFSFALLSFFFCQT